MEKAILRGELIKLIDECLEENKKEKKKKFVDLENSTVDFAKKINQKLMQYVTEAQSTGYAGSNLLTEEGKKAKFKGYDKKKYSQS